MQGDLKKNVKGNHWVLFWNEKRKKRSEMAKGSLKNLRKITSNKYL